jgi:glycosyltransferase involved in cell wall biosynthesis
MNVLYVYDGHWPHNATRVGKQVNALLGAGHKVTILSRGKPGNPRLESDGSLSVIRMPAFRSKALDRIVSYPVFLNPVWVRSIRSHARRIKADAIVVRDLPLAPAALHVGASEGLPVHYDMAEVYPIALHTLLPHESGTVVRVVRATGAAEAIERWVVHRAATTFVVSEESRNRCVGLGVPRERVVLVGNTPANPEALLAEWSRPADIADLEGRPTALFVGNVFADRGLRYAVDAMKAVAREVPNAALVIIGDGRECAPLREQVAREGLGDSVRLLGWKHHRDHPAYLRHSHVGILPFLATEHIRITLANKLFDYMGAGLPVLASDVPPMRRILDETDSGVLVPAADAGALARALVQLFTDAALRERLGKNGKAAIADQYSWSSDAARFVAAIENSRRVRAAS